MRYTNWHRKVLRAAGCLWAASHRVELDILPKVAIATQLKHTSLQGSFAKREAQGHYDRTGSGNKAFKNQLGKLDESCLVEFQLTAIK